MTILAAEAAESAGEGAAAASRARATRTRKTVQSRQQRGRVRDAAAQYGQQARYVAQQGQLTPGNRQYQPVILAEFIAAILLVSLGPIAQPEPRSKGQAPSPYTVNDIKQMVAVGVVYFILALVASGSRGRLAAWFGGLILLAIGLSKAGTGQLKAVFATVGEPPGDVTAQAV